MNISSVRAVYDAALRRCVRLQQKQTESLRDGMIDAEAEVVADVRSRKPLGGVEVASMFWQPMSAYRSTGYSELPGLSVHMSGAKNSIVHTAGQSHADEARIHRRIRELQTVLTTVNKLQNSVLTSPPIMA